MPTYVVTTANLSLSKAQKAQIAAAITHAHHSNTGAPGFFAQVCFQEVADGDHFIGGRPNLGSHIFVHGMIRSGRPQNVKQATMSDVVGRIHEIAGVQPEDVWFYLQDIDASQMVEFGRFLPEPGAENAWRAGISAQKLNEFARAGVSV